MRVLNKLTVKNLKMNRTRTIVTTIGIILSIALITVIGGIASSAWESDIRAMKHINGDYDFLLNGIFDQNDITKLQENPSIRDVYSTQSVAIAKNSSPRYFYRPYIQIVGIEEKVLEACDMKIAEGRFPQKDDELLLSPDLVTGKDKTYQVGDTVTLSIGRRYSKSMDGNKEVAGDALSPDTYYSEETEVFVEDTQRTYTVVGILENENGFAVGTNYSYINAYTYAPTTQTSLLYIRLTDAAEKDYAKVLSQITGVDEQLVWRILGYSFSDADIQLAALQALQSGSHVTLFSINTPLLSAKGCPMPNDDGSGGMLLLVIGFVLLVVIAASVFIIRNSFSISVTEKTKLYGMLSSVGATPGQIRRNVFFEAVILGLVGIPIGILLGVGVIAALLALCNTLLKDALGGMELVFSVPWFVYVIAVVLGIVTILLSALSSAQRAARISPMEAIRSNKDVSTGHKRRKKSLKAPSFLKKLFGVGGSIAWKNMKRNSRQYRTTVISIIVSVAIFLTASSFVGYLTREMESESFYQAADYNMELTLNRYAYDDNGNPIDQASFDSQCRQLASMDGIKKSRLTIFNYDAYQFPIQKEALSADIQNNPSYLSFFEKEDGYAANLCFCAVDDDTFRYLCERNGTTFEESKDKGFVVEQARLHTDTYSYMGVAVKLFEHPAGRQLNGTYEGFRYITTDRLDEDGYPITEEQPVHLSASLELAGIVPAGYKLKFFEAIDNYIVVSMDWYNSHIETNDGESITMSVDAEDPNLVEEKVREWMNDNTLPILSGLQNYARMVNNIRSLILVVQIFVYGFILCIVLIGVTNIFNTITTNMKLRQKEFAMLLSVGTTKREFNRMIHLECLLYTTKSLLIGIPIGLLGSAVMCYLLNRGRDPVNQLPYVLPWGEMLLCLGAVLLLLLVIMRFSVRKVSRMNIIETIRNDNI